MSQKIEGLTKEIKQLETKIKELVAENKHLKKYNGL